MASKMTWDGAADQQLLLSILTTHDVKVDFELVATHLGCTPRAVQERLKKLRKMATEHAASDPTAVVVGPKTPTKTPTKTKSATKTKGAPASTDAPTPSPKKRKTATPKGGKGGSAVAGAVTGAEGKGPEIKAEMVGDGLASGGEGSGQWAAGPEISQVFKEEDQLSEGHDPVLFDAKIGLLSSEI